MRVVCAETKTGQRDRRDRAVRMGRMMEDIVDPEVGGEEVGRYLRVDGKRHVNNPLRDKQVLCLIGKGNCPAFRTLVIRFAQIGGKGKDQSIFLSRYTCKRSRGRHTKGTPSDHDSLTPERSFPLSINPTALTFVPL